MLSSARDHESPGPAREPRLVKRTPTRKIGGLYWSSSPTPAGRCSGGCGRQHEKRATLLGDLKPQQKSKTLASYPQDARSTGARLKRLIQASLAR